MAAVFVDPGERMRDSSEFDEQRSYEYDTLGDRFSKFLLTEVLPEAMKRVHITSTPNGKGIAGRSSGGIGSFVNIRGGGAYPDIIRQSPRKPLRVFLGVRQHTMFANGRW